MGWKKSRHKNPPMRLKIILAVILSAFCILPPVDLRGEIDIDFIFKNARQYDNIVVREVRSANTLVLEGTNGEDGEVIRLIGLKDPEARQEKTRDIKRDQHGFTIKEPVSPEDPLEQRALDYVKKLLEGRRIRLEFDDETKDDDFTTLAYVFLIEGGTFVNKEILRQGFAHLHISPPNMKYAQELRDAYQEARREKRGLQGQY